MSSAALPLSFRTFPQRAGATMPHVCLGHIPAFASLRVPFRWAKGDIERGLDADRAMPEKCAALPRPLWIPAFAGMTMVMPE